MLTRMIKVLLCMCLVTPLFLMPVLADGEDVPPDKDAFLQYVLDTFKYDIAQWVTLGNGDKYGYTEPSGEDYGNFTSMLKGYLTTNYADVVSSAYGEYLDAYNKWTAGNRESLKVGVSGLLSAIQSFFNNQAVPDELHPNDLFNINGINVEFLPNTHNYNYEQGFDLYIDGVKSGSFLVSYNKNFSNGYIYNVYYGGVSYYVRTPAGVTNWATPYLFPVQGKNFMWDWIQMRDVNFDSEAWYVCAQISYDYTLKFNDAYNGNTIMTVNPIYNYGFYKVLGSNDHFYPLPFDKLKNISIPKQLIQQNFNITNNYIFVNKDLIINQNMTPQEVIDYRNNGDEVTPTPTPSTGFDTFNYILNNKGFTVYAGNYGINEQTGYYSSGTRFSTQGIALNDGTYTLSVPDDLKVTILSQDGDQFKLYSRWWGDERSFTLAEPSTLFFSFKRSDDSKLAASDVTINLTGGNYPVEPTPTPSIDPTPPPTAKPGACGFGADTSCTLQNDGTYKCYTEGVFVGSCISGGGDDGTNIWDILRDIISGIGSIGNTIKDIIGGSLEALGKLIGGITDLLGKLLIPSDGFFASLLDTEFPAINAKLGILGQPLDIAISTLNSIAQVEDTGGQISWSGISWQGVQLVPAGQFSFADVLGNGALAQAHGFALDIVDFGIWMGLLGYAAKQCSKFFGRRGD